MKGSNLRVSIGASTVSVFILAGVAGIVLLASDGGGGKEHLASSLPFSLGLGVLGRGHLDLRCGDLGVHALRQRVQDSRHSPSVIISGALDMPPSSTSPTSASTLSSP
ncbi:uncharacterized protein PG998_012065 [Apiospora kogelbergensis]|uniref:uncharacterized protein n=1 Tax=Apiospora kogelbergensis TaxID=1337665 RepID=UPI003131C5F3